MRPSVYAGIFFIWVAVTVLLWLGAQSEPVPAPKPEMPVCKIIIPHLYLQSGWKYWDPAEDGNIANLKRDGKAVVNGDTGGFGKVIAHAESDELLGVHLIGAHVTELIAEASGVATD